MILVPFAFPVNPFSGHRPFVLPIPRFDTSLYVCNLYIPLSPCQITDLLDRGRDSLNVYFLGVASPSPVFAFRPIYINILSQRPFFTGQPTLKNPFILSLRHFMIIVSQAASGLRACGMWLAITILAAYALRCALCVLYPPPPPPPITTYFIHNVTVSKFIPPLL